MKGATHSRIGYETPCVTAWDNLSECEGVETLVSDRKLIPRLFYAHTMPDNDYLIFHEMKEPQSEDKYYNSLFEELKEKCNPSNFLASFDKEKMLIANELFYKILSTTSREDTDLIGLRNEATEKLGIHFSTRRKMEELMGYLNPKLYTDRKPYDKTLVEKSIYFYDKIIQNQDDIARLEEIEAEAADFIKARKNEDTKKTPPNPHDNSTTKLPIAIIVALGSLLTFFAVMTIFLN